MTDTIARPDAHTFGAYSGGARVASAHVSSASFSPSGLAPTKRSTSFRIQGWVIALTASAALWAGIIGGVVALAHSF
jgi:hypothetical protein